MFFSHLVLGSSLLASSAAVPPDMIFNDQPIPLGAEKTVPPRRHPPYHPWPKTTPKKKTTTTTTPMPVAAQTLPETCYTTMSALDDNGDRSVMVETHQCYTYTSVVPAASCPPLSCATPASDLICPMYIKVSSVTVPCTTDCCPLTATLTAAEGPCATCDPCRIPTEWVTYMTGCAGTPTITATGYETPSMVA
ncbi:hypothetical protein F4777DRAFT_378281 [Nemania sp. FL0916]|nr:hypothetical protein F4777DRAFT_378281 [Nemania sp. FL0916]